MWKKKNKKKQNETIKPINDDDSDSSMDDDYIPKYRNGQPSDSDAESDTELVEEASRILKQMSVTKAKQKYKPVDSDDDSSVGSLNSEDARDLNAKLDAGDFSIQIDEDDDDMKMLHEVVDEAIRECCIKVAVISMSANAALLIPGVGKLIAGKSYFISHVI